MPDVHISKRPLLRPAIPSPYSGSQNQKTVYVSVKAPFISTVKRVEKLLQLADKRLVQSATTLAKNDGGKGRGSGKRKRGGDEDEILEIAETVESLKKRRKEDGKGKGDAGGSAGEGVCVRGTGKAIQKVLELGLWFQQREEYAVRLVTGSVGAIDDIEVDEEDGGVPVDQEGKEKSPEAGQGRVDAQAGAEDHGGEKMEIDSDQASGSHVNEGNQIGKEAKSTKAKSSTVERSEIPETRIRYTSSLEVYVSLR